MSGEWLRASFGFGLLLAVLAGAGCPAAREGVPLQQPIALAACRWNDEEPGSLVGAVLSEELTLEQAQARCLELADGCTGVTTRWYVDTPWVAVKASETFVPAQGSYARTIMKSCREPD